ncbi:MAG: LLM class flavin-dependent oxidoreductase [Rhodospirillaceae bacterium]|nr:LLM class flavin-dependent oxidoreductase [Rhodospirillaceae bacterium]|tara:strand:- start:448 stop:1599 length:1152 start_codon:yes stop_codon:yes gene_type:complete
MKYGIFLAPFHDLKENPTQAMQRDMWLLEYLDELGYAEAWVGEHHSGGFEIISCPEVFIAAAAERTKHIKLGTGVVSLPYHHPFMVAGRATQLDHMTRGRFMLGVGPGALVGDAYRMGIDPEAQRRMMNESLDVIVKLMDGETVSMKSDWFEAKDAHLQIPPFTTPRTEMAVACARSPSGALAAGKHGLGMLSIGGTNDEALIHHANNWRMCEEEAAENGKTVSRKNWRLVTLMHIAETREEARRNVEYGLEDFATYFKDISTFPIVPHEIDNAYEYLMENRVAVIGTPDDAIEYIETLLEGSGGFGSLMQLAHNWADWEATKRNYELIARYVMPHFQKSNLDRTHSYNYSRDNKDKFQGQAAQAVQSEIERYEEKKKGLAAE